MVDSREKNADDALIGYRIKKLLKFITESNVIEGICVETGDEVSTREIKEYQRFLSLEKITIKDLKEFVEVANGEHFLKKPLLRDKKGLNVYVGNYTPPKGGPDIKKALEFLLEKINSFSISSYAAHCEYEMLHPFTDGNGRSGRAIWLWMTGSYSLPFLQRFYYQSLDYFGGTEK